MNLFIHTINKPSESQRVQCDRDRIRTYDRLLRRQMLYPAELRDQYAERLGFEPRQRLHVDRLAICSITTLAPLQIGIQI